MRSTRLPGTVLVAAVALVVAACGGATDEVPAVGDGTGTVPDGSWRLVEGSVGGETLTLVDGWDVTLDIAADTIGGTAACNGYGGTAAIGDGTFAVDELSWTEMGCEPVVMELEQGYLRALTETETWTTDGELLVLAGPDSRLVFDVLPPVPTADLVGTTWVLDTVISGDAASNSPGMESAWLVLHEDGTLAGSTGCRRLDGTWVDDGAEVLFTEFAALDDPAGGECAPGWEALDDSIVSVLGDGFTVEIEGERLTVMSRGGEGLSYRASDVEGDDAAPTTTTTVPTAPAEDDDRVAVEIRPLIACGDDLTLTDSYIVLADPISGVDCSLGVPIAEGPVFAPDAEAAPDEIGGWSVGARIEPAATEIWNEAAAACFSRTEQCPSGRLAIVVDQRIVSAPTVQTPEFPDEIVISGNFTEDEARALATAIGGTP